MGGRLHSNLSQMTREVLGAIDGACSDTADGVLRTARIFAPKDTYTLISSARVAKNGLAHYTVSFNTPYARRRHYENMKNPQTKLYLAKAGAKEAGRLPGAIRRRSRSGS